MLANRMRLCRSLSYTRLKSKMSTTPRLPVPTSRNATLGRIRTMLGYLVSKRGKYMTLHSTGAAVTYGGTALAMVIFLFNFKPILGRIPYVKQSYELPPAEPKNHK